MGAAHRTSLVRQRPGLKENCTHSAERFFFFFSFLGAARLVVRAEQPRIKIFRRAEREGRRVFFFLPQTFAPTTDSRGRREGGSDWGEVLRHKAWFSACSIFPFVAAGMKCRCNAKEGPEPRRNFYLLCGWCASKRLLSVCDHRQKTTTQRRKQQQRKTKKT